MRPATVGLYGSGSGTSTGVIVLPYARYQLPQNAVRLEAEPFRFPQEAPA